MKILHILMNLSESLLGKLLFSERWLLRTNRYILIACLTCFKYAAFNFYFMNTVESRFYEPPREMKIDSKNRRVREIGGKITVFD